MKYGRDIKFSEIRKIVRKLKIVGWEKVIGEPLYRKEWCREGLKYGQMLSFRHLMDNRLAISEILDYYEEKADMAFREKIRK